MSEDSAVFRTDPLPVDNSTPTGKEAVPTDRASGRELHTLSELMGGADETAVLPTVEEPAARGRAAGEESDGDRDDLLDDEAYLDLQPRRTSRLTLTLVALLILVTGFLLGVEVQGFFG
jgi:hypothetical protein